MNKLSFSEDFDFIRNLVQLPENHSGSAKENQAVQKSADDLVRHLSENGATVDKAYFEAVKKIFRNIQDKDGFNRLLGRFFPSKTEASAYAAIKALHQASLKAEKKREAWKTPIAELIAQKDLTKKEGDALVQKIERHFILSEKFQRKNNRGIPPFIYNGKTVRLTFEAAPRGVIKIKEINKKTRHLATKAGIGILDAVKILQFIETHKEEHLQTAALTQKHQFVHKNNCCPRSLQFDPDGRIWIIFNRTTHRDRLIAKTETKKITRAWDLEAETFYARSVIRRKDFLQDAEQEIRFFKLFGSDTSGVVETYSVNECYSGKQEILKTGIILKEYEGNLADLQHSPLTKTERLQIAVDILTGLKNIHKKDVIHRDIKPENIFIFTDKKGRKRAAIGDFNLACYKHEIVEVAGTPGNIAPEYGLTSSFNNVTNAIDVYNAGMVLNRLLKDIDCPAVQDCVKKMLKVSPNERPTAKGALNLFKKELSSERNKQTA